MTKGGEQPRRIAFVAQSAESLFEDHRKLIEALGASGCELCLLAPSIEPKNAAILAALGGSYIAFEPETKGWLPFGSRGVIRNLAKHLADWSADCVAGIGLPWVWFAARAGKWAKIPRMVTIVDHWPGDSDENPKVFGMSPVRQLLLGLEASTHIVVHNKGIQRQLLEAGVLEGNKTVVVVPGRGVDLKDTPCQELPPLDDGVTFGMFAPLGNKKAVDTFCRAAQLINADGLSGFKFRFAYRSREDENLEGSVVPEVLAPYDEAITLAELGDAQSEADEIAQCHVFVYPHSDEGMPGRVLQALAVGRAVITSQGAGCRETVDEHVNGCLVPGGDVAALVGAMKNIHNRPELLPAMGRASRQKAERNFGDSEVVAKLLSVFGCNS